MERVQFITHHNETYSYIDSVHLALKGGCRWIQLRMKNSDKEEIEQTAIIVKNLCKQYGATFIINDHVDTCIKVNADGVHLGKNDMTVKNARLILGDTYIIGSTANTFEDVNQAFKDGANYIGCGPLRFTTTKEKLSPTLGLDGYKSIVSSMKTHNIDIPVFAIGGIVIDDIQPLMDIGLHGIALSSYILNAKNPIETMNKIINNTNKSTLI